MNTDKRTVILLRWVVIIATSYLVLFSQQQPPSWPRLLFIALYLASNLVLVRLLPPRILNVAVSFGDMAFVLVGICLTPGTYHDLLAAFFLSIFAASLGDSLAKVAIAGFLISGLYGYWALSNAAHLLDPAVLIRIPFLFVITLFYGHMTERTRGEMKEREQAQRRSQTLERLWENTRQVAENMTADKTFSRMAGVVKRALPVEGCAFCFFADSSHVSVLPDHMTEKPSDVELCKLSQAANLLREKGPVLLNSDHRIVAAGEQEKTGLLLHPEQKLAFPISCGETLLGALLLKGQNSGSHLSAEQMQFCHVVTNVIAAHVNHGEAPDTLPEKALLKAEFLSKFGHELRTPLHAIIGFAELLEASIGTVIPPEMESSIRRILTHALSLSHQVNNILTFSQLDTGTPIHHKSLSLKDLFTEITPLVQRLLDRKAVHFQWRVDPAVETLVGDRTMLRLIFMNLLSNAAKFTEKGFIFLNATPFNYESAPEISGLAHTIQPHARYVEISVKDSGVGISAVDRQALQEGLAPFSQGHHSYGLGLGLAVVKRLVDLLGGAIDFHSSTEGGTEFRVVLPQHYTPSLLSHPSNGVFHKAGDRG